MKQESRSINNKSHTFNIGDRKKLMVASYSGCKTPYSDVLLFLQYIMDVDTERKKI